MIVPPLDSIRITSGFGTRVHPITGVKAMHNGIDLGAPEGTPIYAVDNGKVVVSKYTGTGSGEYITIKHNGYYSFYCHMLRRVVWQNQTVKAGDIIGYVGNTGNSTGPHLHFGLCKKYVASAINQSQWFNPADELKKVSMKVTSISPEINGKKVPLEAIEYKDKNYVKLRDIVSALGGKVEYTAKPEKIVIKL